MLALSQPPATEFEDEGEGDGSAAATSKPAQFIAALPKLVCQRLSRTPPSCCSSQSIEHPCAWHLPAARGPHSYMHICSWVPTACCACCWPCLHSDSAEPRQA